MSLRIITPGTVAAPQYGKASPVDWFANDDGTSPVWAGWVHALDAHIGRSTEGNAFADVSGNGRDVTQTGANGTLIGQLDDGFYGRTDRWLNPPGTQEDIFDAGVAGEMSFVQFVFHPGSAGSWNGMTPVSGAGNDARVQFQTNATYNSQTVNYFGTGNANNLPPAGVDSRRATDVFMFGGTAKLESVSTFSAFGTDQPLITALTASGTGGGAVGGPAWRIGSRSSNSPDGSKCVLTVVYSRVITPAEVRLIQLGGLALLDAKGLLS